MIHWNVAPGVIFGAYFAGIGQAGFFFYGKRVQFRAQHDGGTGSVLEDGDHAGAAHMLRDVVSSAAQALGELGRGLGFMPRKFGVLVQIKVEGVGVGIGVFNFFRRWSLSAGNGGEQKHEWKFEQGHGPGSYLPVPESANPWRAKLLAATISRVRSS